MFCVHKRCINIKTKEAIRKNSNYIMYMIIFLFFLLVFWKVPLVQDEWAGQIYNYSKNILQWIRSCVRLYSTLNGRIIAQIVVGFFERNEIMLDTANAVFMTILIGFMAKILNQEKRAYWMGVIWTMLLLVSTDIRVEVYFYATMIYLIPAVLFFGFMLFVRFYKNNSVVSDSMKFCMLCILGILNSCWIEHSGFAFTFIVGIYWVIDLVRNRRINVRFTIFEFLNIISFAIMMLSPGLRLQRQFIVSHDSFFDLVLANIGNTVQAIIYDHKVIFFFFICASIIVVHQKSQKKKFITYIYEIILFLYSGLFGINIMYDELGISIPEAILLRSAQASWEYGFGKSVLGIVLIILLFIPLIFDERKKEIIFIYFVGMFSLLPGIATPNFAHRICFFAFVIIVFLSVNVIKEIKFESGRILVCLIAITYGILFVQVDAYSILIANIRKIQTEREHLIDSVKNEQRLGNWDYDKTLILPMYTSKQLYLGASPQPFYDPIHHQFFLDFYGLDPETLVLFSNYKNELYVSYEQGKTLFEIIPEYPNLEYEYVYYIYNAGQVVWQSEQTALEMMETSILLDTGSYYFVCDMIDSNGGVTSVYSAYVVNNT